MSKSRFSFFFQCAFAFLFCTLLPAKAIIKYLLHKQYQTQTAVWHRRDWQMLFQHKFDCYAGREGPPSLPALEEAQNCSGILQLGQSGLEPLQCVKLCFQNVTSI